MNRGTPYETSGVQGMIYMEYGLAMLGLPGLSG